MDLKKRKIIYLATQSEWGGAQEYIYNLAVNLDKSRFEVLILAGEGNGELFLELDKAGIRRQKLKSLKRDINPVFDVLALFELISVFKKEKPDVIHLNSSKVGFLGSLAGKLLGKQQLVIYTAHGWVFNEPLPFFTKYLYFLIEKISAGWKNIIITLSAKDEQIAKKHSFKSKVVTIANAINLPTLNFLNKEQARNYLKLNQNGLIVGTIANLYPTKGLGCLIEASKLLPNCTFTIIGEGPERPRLERMIKNHGLESRVILTGFIPQAHCYLKAFDCFVLPSVKEGMPYVILKAIAVGLPVVATRVGGLPEIVDNNFLVEPAQPKALAEKITEVLNKEVKQNHSLPSFNEFLGKTFGLYN